MSLKIAPSTDPSTEAVVLVLRASEGAPPDILKGLKVELTKAPFHKMMGVDEGVQMSRADAAWHLAKSQSWDPGTLPVELVIMTVAEAQKAAEAKAEEPDDDGLPSKSALASMKKDDIVKLAIEKGKVKAEDAEAMTKAAVVALFYPE